jgi:release factor glutamine methyltransferase
MTIRTINHVLQEATQRLKECGKQDAAIDARLLLSFLIDYDRVDLLVHGNDSIKQEDYLKYIELINLRINGVPLQHIIGEQDFMGVTFKVNQFTLIPRRETEELVELALDLLSKTNDQIVMDIGTGTGCIPITIALFNKKVTCLGVDISSDALEMARSNGVYNQVDDRITWLLSDVLNEVPNKYHHSVDMIISNPPYIKSEDVSSLMIEVKNYEPILALDGGKDGLDFYRRICSEGKKYLKPEGYILFEIGHDQKEDVMNILIENGFKQLGFKKDLSGLDRIVYAQNNRDCI